MRTRLASAIGGALMILSAAVACDDPFALPDPSIENRVDTVSLWAASGTAIDLPSAYVIEGRRTMRLDQIDRFGDLIDFVFDIDGTGQAQLLPRAAIHLPPPATGVQLATQPFASITLAPTEGYEDSAAVAVDVDDVAIIRGRLVVCISALQITEPYYAKLRVLTIDPAARRMDFEILTNVNCGYRGLAPGLPTR